ncbi:hypothetical protein SteCoe_24726 [Stentor coeruleus]|uniref:Importin N-terminal domain-containing protein n=1 Tax=Stentor coeruleus TaxID=5963 RepID=A0A1R2BGY5_9CILI|nr:hypothetical protein SteCoe_24726 [Stentor coeruleus]
MSSLTQALYSANSLDQSTRDISLRTLTQLSHADPVAYLLNLSDELGNNALPYPTRQLAGLMIKNCLINATNDPLLENIWDRLTPQMKFKVRNNTLGSLASEDKNIRMASSQAVATIACLDISQGQWLEVLDILITNSTNLNNIFKISALRTLGYICDGLNSKQIDRKNANAILTAIATNLDQKVTDVEIKTIALKAFRNSLKFISQNMQNEIERNLIINLLCNCCQDANIQIRIDSMMILCDIMGVYYDDIQTNLNQLGILTYEIIKNDHEDVAKYAVEFWNQAADEEVERLKFENKPYRKYMETAVASLIPLLLEKVHLINEDLDDWTLYKSCASTLGCIAAIIKDKILDYIGNYIGNNLVSDDWHYRAAAALIIGSIAESLNDSVLLVNVVYRNLLKLASDSNKNVRQTASWTISKICEYHIEAVYNSKNINDTLVHVFEGLKDIPKICIHVCWTIVGIFSYEGYREVFNDQNLRIVLDNLLLAAGRSDIKSLGNELVIAVWASIIKIFEEISDVFNGIAIEKLDIFLNNLNNTINVPDSMILQSQICSVFHAIFGKTPTGSITEEVANSFVMIIIKIFTARGTVFEEGLQAIGTLADNLELRFDKYTSVIIPFVNWSLDCNISSICRSALILTGDLTRALGERFASYLNDVLQKIFNVFTNQQLEFDTKIRAIETLTDIGAYCIRQFIPYLPNVMKFINEASAHSLDFNLEKNNPEFVEYLIELREAILNFYIGITNGFYGSKNADILYEYLPEMIKYGLTILQSPFSQSSDFLGSFIGFIGDIAKIYGSKAALFLKIPEIIQLIEINKNSEVQFISETAVYADTNLQII